MLLLELLRPVARRVGELLAFRVEDPELLAFRVEDPELLAFRVEDPELREEPELVPRVELVLREELPRRAPPAAVFAACCAALAACSKSFLSELPNFVVSRRASETNLPRPLYRVLVLAAASRPVWLRRSPSAFCAASSDWVSRFSAAGSLKLAPLRDEERVDLRACGTRDLLKHGNRFRREPNRA